MQNEETDSLPPETHDRSSRQAKGCLLLFLSIALAGFILIIAAIATIVIIDSIRLRGEGYTLEQRVQRYKVACQFLWFDFKEAVSRKRSESSPTEPEIIPCPDDPPDSTPESAPEP